MKTLTTLTAAAALIAGASLAHAQTSTSGAATTNPGSLNAAPTSEGSNGKSGMQTKGSADMKGSSKVKTDQQAQSENNADINKTIAGITALGRVGEADDIGLAVAALLSEGGRWINGQRIEVSGGQAL